MRRPDFGKYGALVAAVGSFLLIFLGVVAVHLQISRLSTEAVSVLNLANWQRTLSQRMARTLLEIRDEARHGAVSPELRAELRDTVTAFGRTLDVLTRGGPARRLDGSNIDLPASQGETVTRLLRRAESLWGPITSDLGPLLDAELIAAEEADAAALVGAGDLPALFNTMNDLAVALEGEARARETTLQRVLWTGLSLAIVTFLYIALGSIGQLRRADRRVERTQKENADILRTVQEGLFLLDRDKRIGAQHSRYLSTIFGRDDLAGAEFLSLLAGKVTDRTLSMATDYVELLFGEHVNEKLVQTLNPLQDVEIGIADARGQFVAKHLDVRFTRVQDRGRTTHLLVTVVDVTARVQLSRELEALKSQSSGQIAMLARLMRGDPARILELAAVVQAGVEEINARLREPSDDAVALREMLDAIFALAHRLKGDAGAFGVDALEASLQQFEALLAGLRGKAELRGDDFLPAAVALDGLLAQVEQLRTIGRALSGERHDVAAGADRAGQARAASQLAAQPEAGGRATVDADSRALEQKLQSIAARVATRQGKSVELRTCGLELIPPDSRRAAGDIALQLVRNAISHGIESPAERLERGKSATGAVVVDVVPNVSHGITLSVHDDGSGIDVGRIRRRLAASGQLSPQRLAALSDREVAARIFEAGFSTRAQEADEDAGSGVGLDVVNRLVQAMGGRVQVQSRPGRGTTFRVALQTSVPVLAEPVAAHLLGPAIVRPAAEAIT